MPKKPRKAAAVRSTKKKAKRGGSGTRARKTAALRSTRGARISAPRWDLSHLYAGPTDPELARDLDRSEKDAAAFEAEFKGKLHDLDGAALGRAIAAYEEIDERLSKTMTYAGLLHAAHVTDPEVGRFFQTTREKANDIAAHLIFFTLEINTIPDEALAEKLKASELAHYGPWLRDVRVFRPHQLSEDLERILHDKSVTGRGAWNRLFDETLARLRFPFRGKMLTESEILHHLSDRDARVRKDAALGFGSVLKANAPTFALITNTVAKDKEIEDRWRHFPRPQSSRNLGNFVEDEVVDALVSAVKSSYPTLSHRYYKLKAKWFGVRQLPYWDRNAPLPEAKERVIPWQEAETTVLGAYRAFSPDMAEVGKRFFDGAWIDAEARPGKDSGAFSHPAVPSAHPYILMNYQGKTRDVMTLAHELGHGVHQVLAGKQGHLQADTPLTLAETASVFGEMLTFQALLAAENDPKRRRVLLAGKVEDMLNTVVRQIAFYDFESRVHEARRKGEIACEELCEFWLAVQRESLGPALKLDGDYRYFWEYIPHFIHTPFYVYAYAFGDCLVNSLYAAYEDWRRSEKGAPSFQERYRTMLAAGGTLRHKELLAPFGLDASDPRFWGRGLKVIEGFIDQLEEIG
ncbi:MAG TPA: M3 family oligoendopeptidase [Alphaproteobacteria bacterium]|nr:M3 family oligoendopeptidase [Alphaproteobacteria bacterium]